MKRVFAFGLLNLIFIGCSGNAPQTAVNTNNSNIPVTSAHSTGTARSNTVAVTKSGTKTKWTQSGDLIDTSKLDAAITEAEKKLKAKPKDETARKALADAYFERAVALTEAKQYASALGDYRRVLKYDPNNEEAETWIKRIIGIYEGLNKEYPKEGEEPPPLKK